MIHGGADNTPHHTTRAAVPRVPRGRCEEGGSRTAHMC